MNRLLKLTAKMTLSLLTMVILLSSCELQPDEEILDDINTELNEKTTDENEGKRIK